MLFNSRDWVAPWISNGNIKWKSAIICKCISKHCVLILEQWQKCTNTLSTTNTYVFVTVRALFSNIKVLGWVPMRTVWSYRRKVRVVLPEKKGARECKRNEKRSVILRRHSRSGLNSMEFSIENHDKSVYNIWLSTEIIAPIDSTLTTLVYKFLLIFNVRKENNFF